MKMYILGVCFILFDILTGVVKALYQGKLNSTALRQGLFHKLSELLAIIGSGGLSYACEYINIGIDLPILNVVVTYICVMELISVIENLCEINPKFITLWDY